MIEVGRTTERGNELRDPDPGSRRLRFLVVDDDPLNRTMMELMLSPMGYELESACDGAEALEAIRSREYDLVFLDLMLPDMNGRDVCRKVREWEAGKRHLPIVAVTAYDMPGQPMELFKAGMDDYIFKPYDVRGLSRIIQLYVLRDGDPGAAQGEPAARAPAGGEPPVLDTKGSLEDLSNDVEAYKQLLNDFLAGLPARLERMQRALDAADYERLNRECHTLKGVSAGLGAMRLSRLATQLGRSCADGQRASVPSLLQEMENAIRELTREGETFLRS